MFVPIFIITMVLTTDYASFATSKTVAIKGKKFKAYNFRLAWVWRMMLNINT